MCTLSGHAKTLEDSDAASLEKYWNDVEEAASDRHTGKAQAWVDYHLADYGARVTALTTMDGTLGTPWTGFLEDFAVAERSWWSTQKGQYLAYVGKVNAEAEGYQSTAGGKFVGMVGSITTADVTSMGTLAPALATEARNMATAESRYAGRHATAKQDYQVDHATAIRDFTINEDEPAKTAALAQAAKKYGIAEVSADGDRKVDLAKVRQQYVDAAQAATLTWTGTKSRAVRDFGLAESKAWRDRRVNMAELDGDYAVEEADSYADAIELLATTRPTPWATLDAQQARAWAIDQAEWSEEALKSATASADAGFQLEKTEAEAEQRREMDEARATAKKEKAKAQAEVTKAEQERDAANRQAQAGAASVGTPNPVAPATSKAPQIEQAPPEDYTENRQSEKDDSRTLGDWSELPIVRDQTETTPAEEIDILATPGEDESVVGDKEYGAGAPETIVYSDELGTITEEHFKDGRFVITVAPSVGFAGRSLGDPPTPRRLGDQLFLTYIKRAGAGILVVPQIITRLDNLLHYHEFSDDGHIQQASLQARREYFVNLAKKLTVPENGTWRKITINDWTSIYPTAETKFELREDGNVPWFREASFWLGGMHDFEAKGSYEIRFSPDRENPGEVLVDIRSVSMDWRWVDKVDARSVLAYPWRDNFGQGLLEVPFGDILGDKALNGDFYIRVNFRDTTPWRMRVFEDGRVNVEPDRELD